jgi:hypothetical protein
MHKDLMAMQEPPLGPSTLSVHRDAQGFTAAASAIRKPRNITLAASIDDIDQVTALLQSPSSTPCGHPNRRKKVALTDGVVWVECKRGQATLISGIVRKNVIRTKAKIDNNLEPKLS